MNPGVLVMGGGGAGGGSGGKGGRGGNGKQGAGGKNGGENANGGGKGAGKCGQGKNGKCTNCGQNVIAGDPIDPFSGRVFTLPQSDLYLPGPTDLDLVRVYNSNAAARDVGLGHGWAHALAWSVEVHRKRATVWQPDGKPVEFELPDVSAESLSTAGWRLRRFADRFELRMGDDEFLHVFARPEGDGARFRLTCVEDRNSNRVTLHYDERGALTQIIDTAGRVIRARATREGRIASLEVKDSTGGSWLWYASYEYDANGDLVAVRRPGGFHMTYAYRDHLMTAQRFPNGLTFFYVYDEDGRCTETWGEYPGRNDPALASNLPATLADGRTGARGIYHVKVEYGDDGYREIIGPSGVQRLSYNEHGKLDKGVTGGAVTTRTYDERGNVTSTTNTVQATTRFEYDAHGRLVREIAPGGGVTEHRRDDAGRIVETLDPEGASTQFWYDGRDNLVAVRDPRGGVTEYAWDSRGLMTAIVSPNGARTTFSYDAHGNPIEIVEPTGARWRQTYNAFGRCTSMTSPTGATTRWSYDDAMRITAQHDPNGGVVRYAYDAMGLLVSTTEADGGATETEYGGYFWPVATRSPTGEVIRWTYDREGMVVETYNERGEIWRFAWDARGALREERAFDGRATHYQHDTEGRLVFSRQPSGQTQELVWNEDDDLIRAIYDDGTELSFEHDLRGQLLRAEAPRATVQYRRNAMGDIVEEEQTIDGETFVVQTSYDLAGQQTARLTSWGLTERFERDAAGWRTATALDGLMVRHERDLMGNEVRRALGDDVAIESEFDGMGWLSRRRVTRGADAPRLRPGEPAWVGRLPTSEIELRYGFSPTGEVVSSSDLKRGETRYAYDMNGRLLSVDRERGPREVFRYDATSNHHPIAPHPDDRVFGPGDRLLQRAGARYTWDDSGQLVEKRVREPGAPAERVWKYAWDSRGMLKSVTTPEGDVVEFLYDAFGRRVQKRHLVAASPRERLKLRAVTRYVWAGPMMIYEVRRTVQDAEQPHVETRAYVYEDDEQVPLLQRESRAAAGAPVRVGPWHAYVNDMNDTPEYLITPRGEIACALRRSAWGETSVEPGASTTTPLRFLGQYHDPETGLHYNRMRYYDPEVGRYISADPVALVEGLPNAFRYGINPISWSDPWGLHAVTGVRLTFADGTTASPPTQTNNRRQRAGFFSGYSKRFPWKSDPYCQKLGPGKAYWQSHTERKAMRWADSVAKKKEKSLEGAHLEMRGELAPCNTCHAAMKAWSKKTGAKVTYTWPRNKSRSYDGGVSKGSKRLPYSNASG
ncbi:RHS repeat-associated core domain-containing protein [Sorangium cellulosum]|uniref:RHS repeat-associated core domain-containing protein n=1 Tax=Sorangium cellulosum TaxID=56 RepID=UPI003D9A11F5